MVAVTFLVLVFGVEGALLHTQGLPFTIFQPLYLYGPYNGKDQIGYFLNRIMRERPVPLPAPGNQLTSLTHIEDMAALLAKVCAPNEPHTYPS